MKNHPVFQLPPLRVGPYLMHAVPATRDMFVDKRRKVESFWSTGVVLIDESLNAEDTFHCFVRFLVACIHYRSGLNDRSNEESFTHSLASGFVELALTNPEFWVQFNKLLDQTYRPEDPWQLTAMGLVPPDAYDLPGEVTYRGKRCPISWVSHEECAKYQAYGFFCPRGKFVELSESLRGTNLPLVALHEVFHFFHDCQGLKDSSKEKEFITKQVRALKRLWAENQEFWHWWLGRIRAAAQAPAVRRPACRVRRQRLLA